MATNTEPGALRFIGQLIWGFIRTSLLGFLMLLGVGGLIAIAAGAVSYLFGSYIVTGLAASLISIGALFLQWTGAIFNSFIENLIAKFTITLQGFGIMNGIDVVWAAFRDVSNIALIGLFVFLAINIILGVKSFGEKRMIARVLIVAVLLNFSLLFSKIIIDASNFAAYQFYKSAGLPDSASGASGGGVADAFLNAVGITSIGDTASGIKALADTKGTPVALGFSVIAVFLLLLMIGLFIYGAFLIIVRSVLLVFLMVVSPLAFVSWLVPNNKVEMGWSKWWETLIGSAFFAPLFMMSLWASMILLEKTAQQRGNATLGQFFTSPTINSDAWAVIFVYAFAAGLLYASIKFASSFSHSLAGYNFAAPIAGLPFLTAAALGNRALRITGRQTFGKAAYNTSDKLKERAGSRDSGSWGQWLYGRGSERFGNLAKRDFDAMGVKKVGDKLTAAFGGATALSLQGSKIGGFEGLQKAYMKSAKEFSERVTPSDDDKEKARAAGIQKTIDGNEGHKKAYNEAESSVKKAADHLETVEREAYKKITDATATIGTLGTKSNPTNTEKSKLRDAERELKAANDRIKEAQKVARAATEAFHDTVGKIEKIARDSGDIPEAMYRSKADIGKAYVEKSRYSRYFKATGMTEESNAKLAAKVEKELMGPTGTKAVREKTILDHLKDMGKNKKRAEVRDKRSLGVRVGDAPAPKDDAKPADDKK